VTLVALVPHDLLFPHFVGRLVEAGVRFCLDPQCGDEMVVEALDSPSEGAPCFSPQVNVLLSEFYALRTAGDRPAKRQLSDRQIEVAQLLSGGLTADEVADTLNLSRHTVLTHRMRIYAKAGVHCVAELKKWMQAMGLAGAQEY